MMDQNVEGCWLRLELERFATMQCSRDAWGYGAIDPSSGAEQVMELVRAFGKMKQSGWRPKGPSLNDVFIERVPKNKGVHI